MPARRRTRRGGSSTAMVPYRPTALTKTKQSGIRSWASKLNQFIKNNKLVSRGLNMAHNRGVKYTGALAKHAALAGYGTRLAGARYGYGTRLAGGRRRRR